MSKCVIGINPEGEIVSHYGGLFYEMKIDNNSHSLIWGVNAYTLPDWRGMTCPPKTNPRVMLGLDHTGGRKDGKAHTIYTGADHYKIA